MNQTELYTAIEAMTVEQLAGCWVFIGERDTSKKETYETEARLYLIMDSLLQYWWMETHEDGLKAGFYMTAQDWIGAIPDAMLEHAYQIVQDCQSQPVKTADEIEIIKETFIKQKLGLMGFRKRI
jgi:hypothetical protein